MYASDFRQFYKDQIDEGNMETLRELIDVICTDEVVEGFEEPVGISSLLSEDPETYIELAKNEGSAQALKLLDEDLECAQE